MMKWITPANFQTLCWTVQAVALLWTSILIARIAARERRLNEAAARARADWRVDAMRAGQFMQEAADRRLAQPEGRAS